MSPDFRYHIASLAAVFLALGVGIVVGTAFVGAPVVDRQTRLIRSLETRVGEMQKETGEKEKNEEALRELVPFVVKNRLSKPVLLIQTGGSPQAADEAAEALRFAGASEIVRVQLPADGWRKTATDTESANNAATNEAKSLAPLLAAGDKSAWETYRQRGLLSLDGSLPTGSGAFRYVVLVGGVVVSAPNEATATPDFVRQRDTALITALHEAGVSVVGVEAMDADGSFVRTCQSAGISTVDCVDRAVGKIALPFVLAGEKGDYGLKSGANRVLPASLETPPVTSPAAETAP